MEKQFENMRFMDFVKPTLSSGEHTVSMTQEVTAPMKDKFTQQESFYVASRCYTLAADDVFCVSPSENESGDLSKTIPFLTLKNKTLPWEYKIAEDIGQLPVPWVALIVISAREKISESDMTIKELLTTAPPNGVYFPPRNSFPQVVIEKDEDMCHVLELPIELYNAIMPDFEDMTYLAHARRVDLFNTEDTVAAMDGDFSVILANRFVPTGETELLQSTVHLVSMLGMPEKIPEGNSAVRLVSLYHFKVFSVHDNSETFQNLINNLEKNTGMVGFDQKNEIQKKCYVPKKHYTRSGEFTYSLYRSPFLPYKNPIIDSSSKHTADGHLIYDPKYGVFDASYAAAFQIGRLIALSHKADSQKIVTLRKKRKMKVHKQNLSARVGFGDISKWFEKL